jgi:hypothetical protein
MIRRLKEIGVALVVVSALNAAAASPAWAVAELNPEQAPAVIRGVNNSQEKLEFNLQGNSEKFKLVCEFIALEGKATTKTVTQITMTPEPSLCQVGVNKLTPKVNGCKFVWKMTAALTAKLDIAGCTTGKVIEFATFGCTITIPEQTGLSHVTFQNVAWMPNYLWLNQTISGLTYTQDGLVCPASNGTTKTDGEMTGQQSLKASIWVKDTTGQSPITGHQFTYYEWGSWINLQAS